jgi:hypothetical protein
MPQVAADHGRVDPEDFRDDPLRAPCRPTPGVDHESCVNLGDQGAALGGDRPASGVVASAPTRAPCC